LGNGNGSFQNAVNFNTGQFPLSVAVGDLNGDGKPDLAVANSQNGTVSVLLGNGNGTFQNAVNFPTGLSPTSVAVADVNGDGKQDLAVANSGSNSVSVLLGNGNGSFAPAVNFSTGLAPLAVAVADLNGDDKPDLVVANDNGNSVSVLLGNGNGSFQNAVNFNTGQFPLSVAVGDLNGDGIPDLAVTSGSGVSVLLGQANVATHLLLSAPSTATTGTPFALTVRALDAQGNVASRYTGTVLVGSSDGAFAPFLYTFLPTDFGVHTFTITPGLAGGMTVTAQDQVTSSILGTVPVLVL
jgi:hypothetical protein